MGYPEDYADRRNEELSKPLDKKPGHGFCR